MARMPLSMSPCPPTLRADPSVCQHQIQLTPVCGNSDLTQNKAINAHADGSNLNFERTRGIGDGIDRTLGNHENTSPVPAGRESLADNCGL